MFVVVNCLQKVRQIIYRNNIFLKKQEVYIMFSLAKQHTVNGAGLLQDK